MPSNTRSLCCKALSSAVLVIDLGMMPGPTHNGQLYPARCRFERVRHDGLRRGLGLTVYALLKSLARFSFSFRNS